MDQIINRKTTRQVMCGNVAIGGGAAVSIQSMTNTDTRDAEATIRQVNALAEAGCQIVRCAVPDMQAAKALEKIKKASPVPIVADIHFDYKLALASMDSGVDKVRINPGNIGSDEKVSAVLEKAKACRIPIRIGVNSGSVEKDIIAKYGGVTAEGLAESAVNAAAYAQSFGFDDIVISLKSSDAAMNFRAHQLFSEKSDLPMHIGLTESGGGKMAEIKSSAAIGALLLSGIGDTMRVSLTGDPVREVILARQILKACGIRRGGIDFVSCPTCGRTMVDLPSVAEAVEAALMPLSDRLEKEGKSLRVAVMGCAVNGPGEARNADIGLAGGVGEFLIIRKGEILRKVSEDEACGVLVSMAEELSGSLSGA